MSGPVIVIVGFILITGRTLRQGTSLHLGKGSDEYRIEVTTVELSEHSMKKLGLREGDKVRIKSAHGSIKAICRRSNLPSEVAFMSCGYRANLLIGSDTEGTGMPSSKGIMVEITRETEEEDEV